MITGSADNNVMIWTSPFNGYQGEELEGVDVSMPKGPKGSSPKRGGGAIDTSMQQADEHFGNRGNQSMNIEVMDTYNQMFTEPQVSVPATQTVNPQLNQSEV